MDGAQGSEGREEKEGHNDLIESSEDGNGTRGDSKWWSAFPSGNAREAAMGAIDSQSS